MKYKGRESLERFYKKRIKVSTKDGNIQEGLCSLYTSEGDNEPEPESISLEYADKYIEIFVPDITKIEII